MFSHMLCVVYYSHHKMYTMCLNQIIIIILLGNKIVGNYKRTWNYTISNIRVWNKTWNRLLARVCAVNNCLIKTVQSYSLCGVLSLKSV